MAVARIAGFTPTTDVRTLVVSRMQDPCLLRLQEMLSVTHVGCMPCAVDANG